MSRARTSRRLRASHRGAGKHAVQPLENRLAQSLVEVTDDFPVRTGTERCALRLQFPPQFRGIVDFPVVEQHHVASLIEKRLVPAVHVVDGKTAHPAHELPIPVHPLGIGTAMNQSIEHSLKNAEIGPVGPIHAADAAHQLAPPANSDATHSRARVCATARSSGESTSHQLP